MLNNIRKEMRIEHFYVNSNNKKRFTTMSEAIAIKDYYEYIFKEFRNAVQFTTFIEANDSNNLSTNKIFGVKVSSRYFALSKVSKLNIDFIFKEIKYFTRHVLPHSITNLDNFNNLRLYNIRLNENDVYKPLCHYKNIFFVVDSIKTKCMGVCRVLFSNYATSVIEYNDAETGKLTKDVIWTRWLKPYSHNVLRDLKEFVRYNPQYQNYYEERVKNEQ